MKQVLTKPSSYKKQIPFIDKTKLYACVYCEDKRYLSTKLPGAQEDICKYPCSVCNKNEFEDWYQANKK